MTRPIDVLIAEHALHRRALAVLERMSARVEEGLVFPSQDVARVIGFFREFVETVHHAKEDGMIYPLVLSIGDDEVAEIVGRLIADHDDTRELLRMLSLFWEPGDLLAAERAGFCELVRTYSARMRRHMDLEERHLFPAALEMSADEAHRSMRFFDAVSLDRRSQEEWSAIVADLEEHWPS